jgi:hypothetical protein
MAIVSIKTQQVTFYDADGWILRAPVSSGVKGRETPAGIFAVVEKDKDHHSSMYDDAWMPNMQRITWNGVACTAGRCPDMQPRTAACACPTALRRSCSTRRGSGCGCPDRNSECAYIFKTTVPCCRCTEASRIARGYLRKRKQNAEAEADG